MDVTTRSGEDDPIHQALRAALCVPTRRWLWTPEDEIEFVPGLSDTIYGDGRALYRLTTLRSRPAFYVIRGDSGWSVHDGLPNAKVDFVDLIDRFYNDLESQFGYAGLDSDEEDPELLELGAHPWPAFDADDGSSWGRLNWPQLQGIEVERLCGGRPSTTILKSEYAIENRVRQIVDDGHVAEETGYQP